MTNLKYLLKTNQHQFQNILNHSFNQGLFSGNLPTKTYQFFVDQDTLYLQGFTNILRLIALKMNDTQYRDLFRKLHEDCMIFEQSMLANTSQHLFKPVITSSLTNYLKHLAGSLANDTPVIVSIAAIFPCFWIYCELGKHAKENYDIDRPDHPYKDWLGTYTDPTYVEATDELMHAFEHLLQEVEDSDILDRVKSTFSKSFSLEYEFFADCCTNHSALEIMPETTARI